MKLQATTIGKAMGWVALGVLVFGFAQQNNPPAPPAGNVGIYTIALARTENNNMPENFTLDLRAFYIAPGGRTTLHYHAGPVTLIVMEGELTYIEKGVEKVYKAGESWTEGAGPDHPHRLVNNGKTVASFALAGIMAKGGTFTTVVGE